MKNLQATYEEVLSSIADMIENWAWNYDTHIAQIDWERYIDKQTSFSSSILQDVDCDFYHKIHSLSILDQNAQEWIDNWLSYEDLAQEYIDRKTWNL
jgi:hypothetical protein